MKFIGFNGYYHNIEHPPINHGSIFGTIKRATTMGYHGYSFFSLSEKWLVHVSIPPVMVISSGFIGNIVIKQKEIGVFRQDLHFKVT